jgi:hypothetical protein
MPLYHSTIFSGDHPGTAFKAAAAAWQYEKASGVFRGTRDELHAENERIRLERGHAPSQNYYGDGHPVFFDMEIMIRATTEQRARQAVILLCSAIDVLHGTAMGYEDPIGGHSHSSRWSEARYAVVLLNKRYHHSVPVCRARKQGFPVLCDA